MSDIVSAISSDIPGVISTIITGVIGYLGVRIKNIIKVYYQDRTKKEIVEKTVKYVEQTCKNDSCDEKKKKALDLSLNWLKEKKISISDTELEILIESAVNCLE